MATAVATRKSGLDSCMRPACQFRLQHQSQHLTLCFRRTYCKSGQSRASLDLNWSELSPDSCWCTTTGVPRFIPCCSVENGGPATLILAPELRGHAQRLKHRLLTFHNIYVHALLPRGRSRLHGRMRAGATKPARASLIRCRLRSTATPGLPSDSLSDSCLSVHPV